MKKDNNLKYLAVGVLGFAISFFIIAIFLLFNTDNRYSVIFSDSGKVVKIIKVKRNGTVSKPTGLDKSGYEINYTFGDEEYNFNNKVTGNIVIEIEYSLKEPVIEVNEYNVSFNTNGGNSIDSIKVKENEKVAAPQNPVKENYKFVEWQLNGVKYDFDSLVTEDIELVAVWEEIKVEPEPTTTPSPSPSTKPTESPKPSNSPTPSTNPSPSPSTNPSPSPSTSPEPTQEVKNYTIRISQVDAYSPDCYLTVYENDSAISVKGISYSDGVSISASISGTKITVAKADIDGETSFKVKLNDNSTVIAYVR